MTDLCKIASNHSIPRKKGILVTLTASTRLIPLWIKLLYTAFMAVLIPVYLHHYGPTNFLYF